MFSLSCPIYRGKSRAWRQSKGTFWKRTKRY